MYLVKLIKRVTLKPSRILEIIKHKIATTRVREIHRYFELWVKAEMSRDNYKKVFVLPDTLSYKNLTRFQYMPNIQFLEIGCFLGFTSNFLIENFLMGENSKLTCIDPWIDYSESSENAIEGFDEIINNKTYGEFIENTKRNEDKLVIRRGLSKDVLPTLNNKFHFIFIDGDHSTSAVWKDAVLSMPMLIKGGYLLFDDYDWNQGKSNPKKAIDYFEHVYKEYIQKLPTYNNQKLYRLIRDVELTTKPDLHKFD